MSPDVFCLDRASTLMCFYLISLFFREIAALDDCFCQDFYAFNTGFLLFLKSVEVFIESFCASRSCFDFLSRITFRLAGMACGKHIFWISLKYIGVSSAFGAF